jgi:hypothetical protein
VLRVPAEVREDDAGHHSGTVSHYATRAGPWPDHKIEIPGSGTLTQLILDVVGKHKQELVERVRTTLPSESRQVLDTLFQKAPATAEDLKVQRARLTLLKRFSHSTKPSKIKENFTDLQTIRALYQPLRSLVRSLDLTPDGLRYYAQAVIKAEVFQVERRADPERHLHLLCCIAHQYFHLHDLLMDVLLMAVQSTRRVCQREHQDQYYVERTDRQQAVQSLVENVERAVCDPLAEIERIAFQKQLAAREKVQLIQNVLRKQDEERHALQDQMTRLKEDLQHQRQECGYYAVLERKSVKLQNKVAGILQQVRFE